MSLNIPIAKPWNNMSLNSPLKAVRPVMAPRTATCGPLKVALRGARGHLGAGPSAVSAARVNTDEWQGYNHIIREHVTVNHGNHEWARDDDGDGIREVHTNSAEGMWTGLRIFLGPFRGVHKKYLSGYVAIYEHAVNLKKISPKLISALVQSN